MIFLSGPVERALEQTRAEAKAQRQLEELERLDRTYHEIALLMNSFSAESLKPARSRRGISSWLRRSKRS